MTDTEGAPAIRGIRRRVVCLLLMGIVVPDAPSVLAQTPGATTTLYTQEDLLFLSHMIVHHRQALELAALVPSRTSREELIRFARQVDGAQRAEIDQMESLLTLAADRGTTVPHHDPHADQRMPGLLPKAQTDAVAAAKGAAFERLWLEGMIVHHEGALTMGRAQQRQQSESGRQPYGIDVLVDEILVVQRAEITKMKAWLTQWGLSSSGRRSDARRAEVVAHVSGG
jgi:uncharacterized protein (DUF305 family)